MVRSLVRSLALLGFASGVLASCGGGGADPDLTGWRKEVGQVRIGANMSEETDTVIARWDAFKEQIARATGLPVEVFQAMDYNGVLQAMASGQLELGSLGPTSYANARNQMGERVAPILAPRTAEGSSAYYSLLVVRADSPYRTLNDLRGRTVGYADFNSTSGYVYPRWAMQQQGLDPEGFFGANVVSGGHTQSLMALSTGQFDAVFLFASGGTPETGFTDGTLERLARRGLIKYQDYRVVWTAGPIPNSPYVIRTDRPQAFQDIARGALAAMPYENPEGWVEIGLLEGSDMIPVRAEDYANIVAMRDAEVARARNGTPGGKP